MLRHPRQTAARFGLGFTRIPVERLLRSGESGIPANQYARLIGRPLRASERVMDGPQVAFLRRYAEIGRSILEAYGVERDPFAIAIGTGIYGLPAERFTRSDVAGFLAGTAEFGVVSCLSVAHHFALGKEAISVGDLLARLGRATRRVLFFDTGEQHERWFQRSLPEWTPEFIRRQLLERTGLGRVVPLGQDSDGRGRFHGNYGRTLFACVRT